MNSGVLSIEMHADVIVLNGGSSSGKSTLARRLQDQLGESCLTLSVDDFVHALPGGDQPSGARALGVEADGSVTVNEEFRRAESAWYQGLAAIARSGTRLIVDEVFLGGRASQERLAHALTGLAVLWVGVRCDPEVAAARESERGDRVVGMARRQAELVHDGVVYDVVVDTTHTSPPACARAVIARLNADGKEDAR